MELGEKTRCVASHVNEIHLLGVRFSGWARMQADPMPIDDVQLDPRIDVKAPHIAEPLGQQLNICRLKGCTDCEDNVVQFNIALGNSASEIDGEELGGHCRHLPRGIKALAS